jgi:hypothetical protein
MTRDLENAGLWSARARAVLGIPPDNADPFMERAKGEKVKDTCPQHRSVGNNRQFSREIRSGETNRL